MGELGSFDQSDTRLTDPRSIEDRARNLTKHIKPDHQSHKKNQKLFADDSEEEEEHYEDQEEDHRSTLVKKLFYKDSGSPQNKKPRDNKQSTAAPAIPDSVQKVLDEKKDQLDRAIRHYEQEQNKLNQLKIQIEQ